MELIQDEKIYYKGQLNLDDIGEEGQKILKSKKAVVVGLGGLGSPAAIYLASSGIGTLGLIDFDYVERSNLSRQIIHSTLEIGYPKVVSAKHFLKDLNPHIKINTHHEKLTDKNAKDLLEQYDVVIDCTDNFTSRYLLNDACYFLGKPLIHGSVSQFKGQMTVFHPKKNGPCYRCLYPAPLEDQFKSCSVEGILGTVPGIIGLFEALETQKVLLDIGTSSIGKILLIDMLKMDFKTLHLEKDKDCPLCGTHPTIKELKSLKSAPCLMLNEDIEQNELENRKDILFLDVRENDEHQTFNLGGLHFPLNELEKNIESLHPFREREIVIYCQRGQRSIEAHKILKDHQFKKIKNLKGGLESLKEIEKFKINVLSSI